MTQTLDYRCWNVNHLQTKSLSFKYYSINNVFFNLQDYKTFFIFEIE